MESFTSSLADDDVSIVSNTTDNHTGPNVVFIQPLYMRVPSWSRGAISVYIFVVFLIGMIGNAILIAASTKKKKKTSTDMYVLCLAGGGMVALLLCPLDFGRYTVEVWGSLGSDGLCRSYFFLQGFGSLFSTLLVFGIGLDRFFNVFRPYSTAYLVKASKPASICALITSALYSLVFLISSHQSTEGVCKLNPEFRQIYTLSIVIGNGVSLVISLALGAIYTRIATFLRKRHRAVGAVTVTASTSNVTRATSNVTRATNPNIFLCERLEPQPLQTPHLGVPSVSNLEPMAGRVTVRAEDPNTNTVIRHQRDVNNVTRTTVTMVMITVTFVVTNVLPAMAIGILTLTQESSESVLLFTFIAIRLPYIGYAVNPIWLLTGSWELRKITSDMFQFISRCPRGAASCI